MQRANAESDGGRGMHRKQDLISADVEPCARVDSAADSHAIARQVGVCVDGRGCELYECIGALTGGEAQAASPDHRRETARRLRARPAARRPVAVVDLSDGTHPRL